LIANSRLAGLPASSGVADVDVLNASSKKRTPLAQPFFSDNSGLKLKVTSSQSKPHAGQVALTGAALWF
jgi:hypothetical protein